MWRHKRVSVVLMTYAERDSIRSVIEDFDSTGVVDEIIVIDNNAEPGTAAEVAATRARRVVEKRQGYGYASRRGLAEASGDVVVLAEPDGTFVASDIVKLLSYSDEFDVVFGTRTLPAMIRHGANMGRLLRWGNWAVAKLITVLFRTNPLTDVGCTYKLLSREAVDEVLPRLRVGSNELSPELMVSVILADFSYVEIPVNYLPRVGESSVTGHMWKAVVLGVRMILLILRMRLESIMPIGGAKWASRATAPAGSHTSRLVAIHVEADSRVVVGETPAETQLVMAAAVRPAVWGDWKSAVGPATYIPPDRHAE